VGAGKVEWVFEGANKEKGGGERRTNLDLSSTLCGKRMGYCLMSTLRVTSMGTAVPLRLAGLKR
jgi:hypothetical protein